MNNKKIEAKIIMNKDIIRKYPEVRITGKDVESKVMTSYDALKIAESRDEDLILLTPNANPPVCKIIELNKFLYEKKKAKKDQEKKARENRVDIKEIRFKPRIEYHDFEFKKKHIINFLKGNNKVKCSMLFRGRENAYTDEGKVVLLRMAEDVSDYGIIESMPILSGNRMIMTIKPKKK